MTPPFDTTGTVITINCHLLYAVLLVAVAYWIWPTDPRWYGFGLMSIVLYLAAGGLVFNALRSMWKLHALIKEWSTFQTRGKAPKNAKLASPKDLETRGMK